LATSLSRPIKFIPSFYSLFLIFSPHCSPSLCLPLGRRTLACLLDQRQQCACLLLLSRGKRGSHCPQPARHVGIGFCPQILQCGVGKVNQVIPALRNCDAVCMYGTPWAASFLVTVLSAILLVFFPFCICSCRQRK
jgi:hypothetical protein